MTKPCVKAQTVLPILAIVTAIAFASGCDKSSKLANSSAPVETSNCQGTCDGGGGNGVDNKVYESYIVDPTKLSGFEKLKPLFTHLDKIGFENQEKMDPGAKDNEKQMYSSFFKMKKWYVAPIRLQPIDKQKLGMSFSKSETQQIAFQTDAEIWIDKDIFDKMNASAQADLILHEYVMSLYFVKYKTMQELCKLSDSIFPERKSGDCDDKSYTDVDALMPAEKLKPLDAKDVVVIRNVTDFFAKDAINRKLEEIETVLLVNGFDKRMFNHAEFAVEATNTRGASADFFAIAKAAELLNMNANTCEGIQSGKTLPCKFEQGDVVETDVDLKTSYKVQLGDRVIEQKLHVVGESGYHRFADPMGKREFYFMYPARLRGLSSTVGQKSRNVMYLFDRRSNIDAKAKVEVKDLEFLGIVSWEAVVTAPSAKKVVGDKTEYVDCRMRIPKTNSIFDDVIIVTRPGFDSQLLKWWLMNDQALEAFSICP